MGQNRRMSKDYERLPESSEAFIYVAMSRLRIRTLEPTIGEVSGFATGLERPIDLEVSKAGELYYLARDSTGSTAHVSKIGYAAN